MKKKSCEYGPKGLFNFGCLSSTCFTLNYYTRSTLELNRMGYYFYILDRTLHSNDQYLNKKSLLFPNVFWPKLVEIRMTWAVYYVSTASQQQRAVIEEFIGIRKQIYWNSCPAQKREVQRGVLTYLLSSTSMHRAIKQRQEQQLFIDPPNFPRHW